MNTQHTPGPWKIEGRAAEGFVLVRSESGDNIANVCEYGQQSETPDAQTHNARLIAAAPGLLAAAELANKELLALGVGSSGSPALQALWTAIANAKVQA